MLAQRWYDYAAKRTGTGYRRPTDGGQDTAADDGDMGQAAVYPTDQAVGEIN